jgi:hypothetical protein
VELRPAKTLTRDIQLTRVVRLDSVKVLATKPRYAEFERNMRTNPMGKFMTMGEIQRRNAATTGELLRVFGWTVARKGMRTNARPKSTVSRKCMNANVVIDGMDGMSVDDVQPKAIAGLEVYSDASVAPARYGGNAECGLVVIWLRTKDEKRPETKNGLNYNGYP